MQYKKFENKLVLRLDPGEEIFSSVEKVCKGEGILLGSVSGIGAISSLIAGVYDVQKKEYIQNSFEGAFEIVSLAGNITTKNGNTYVHLHISVGDDKGRVFGGHLNSAVISATAEIFIDIIDGKVEREVSKQTGLNIFLFN